MIEDTGIGIPRERITEIFDTFQPVHDEIDVERGGSGLGLAIANLLARKMKGGISVESVLGEGSVFTVVVRLSLPQNKGHPPHKSAQGSHIGLLRGRNLNFLVAEDNAASRHLIKKCSAWKGSR